MGLRGRVTGALLVLASSGCEPIGNPDHAPGAPDVATDELPIVGGTESSRSAVIPILGVGFCTAVLLAPNLVMTAKHCITPVGGGAYDCDDVEGLVPAPTAPVGVGQYGEVLAASSIQVGFSGDSPYAPRVVEVLVAEGGDICTADLALLILDRGFDDPTLAPVRLAATPAVGEALTAVGFGIVTGDQATYTRHERPVNVLAVGPDSGGGRFDAVQPGFFAVGEGLCSGDSGSPAIAASGAAVGVASTLSNPDVTTPTGTDADCRGGEARGKYQATSAHADLLRTAFARAGVAPWEEGQADPRADLLEEGEACDADGECTSNVCVTHPDPERGRVCSQGCLDRACPSDATCETVEGRRRCVPEAGATSSEEGCGVAGARPPGGAGAGDREGFAGLLALVGVAIGLRMRGRARSAPSLQARPPLR